MIIVLSALLLLAVAGFCLSVSTRRQNQILQKQLAYLQNEYRAINSGHLGMGREIRKVSQEVAVFDSLKTTQPVFKKTAKTFEQAGLLLSRGASIDEVVEHFDIAPAEAELLAAMNFKVIQNNHSKSPQSRVA